MLRILLIEDSPTQARAIGLVLEGAGFEVATAQSAEEGLARLDDEPFEMVLTDLMLPGASGLDVCRRINADARWQRIPVVLLTGVDDESMAAQALHEGAQDYLVKGEVNDRWIVRSVRNAIERMQSQRAAPARRAVLERKADEAALEVAQRGEVSVASILERRLLGSTAVERIGGELARLVDQGQMCVLLNMSRVEYLSNAAMGVLLGWHKRLQSVGGRLHLCGLRPEVHENIASRRLEGVFTMHESEDAALDAIQS